MYHFIYRTTNVKNNKYYIGKHSTSNIKDGYIGSGILLKKAIQKYGKENFKFEIIEFCDNYEELNEKEKMYITEQMISSNDCYNVALGGQGGNLGETVNRKIGKAMSKLLAGKPKSKQHKESIGKSRLGYKFSPDVILLRSAKWKERLDLLTEEEKKKKYGRSKEKNGFYGKKHSEDTKQKIREKIIISRKTQLHPSCKKTVLNGKMYNSRKECLEDLGISKRQLYKILGEI